MLSFFSALNRCRYRFLALALALTLRLTSLCCSWFREGSKVPLQSYALKGGSKNHYTNATLQILPRRADDGAKYICVVWNRAMPEGHTLETSVTLNVNCKYPVGGNGAAFRNGAKRNGGTVRRNCLP